MIKNTEIKLVKKKKKKKKKKKAQKEKKPENDCKYEGKSRSEVADR